MKIKATLLAIITGLAGCRTAQIPVQDKSYDLNFQRVGSTYEISEEIHEVVAAAGADTLLYRESDEISRFFLLDRRLAIRNTPKGLKINNKKKLQECLTSVDLAEMAKASPNFPPSLTSITVPAKGYTGFTIVRNGNPFPAELGLRGLKAKLNEAEKECPKPLEPKNENPIQDSAKNYKSPENGQQGTKELRNTQKNELYARAKESGLVDFSCDTGTCVSLQNILGGKSDLEVLDDFGSCLGVMSASECLYDSFSQPGRECYEEAIQPDTKVPFDRYECIADNSNGLGPSNCKDLSTFDEGFVRSGQCIENPTFNTETILDDMIMCATFSENPDECLIGVYDTMGKKNE